MTDTALLSLLDILHEIKEADDLRTALTNCPILYSN
jgi:hypothetical protein